MSSYIPLDLSRQVVKNVFTGCLAHSLTKSIVYCGLFKKENGFSADSKPIEFDEERLRSFSKIIQGMFGQLADAHQHAMFISPSTIQKKYDGTVWLTSRQCLIEFFHLCTAVGILGPLNSQNTAPILKEIYPTLSPKDPNFEAWYDEHRSELLEFLEGNC